MWYSKYLTVFNKQPKEVPSNILSEIRMKLEQRLSAAPLVSIVAIAHNEEKHLVSCLWSLVENECKYPIEILVVNNNSTDNTEQLLTQLGVPYFNEFQKGPGYARQCGLNHAKGKYHLCIDADTLYPPYYIETHIKELMKPGIACTFSLWSFMPDKTHSRFSLWIYESLRDVYLRIQAIKRPELCVRGMTFGFKTELGRKIGFRTDIIRGEDGSLALAMKPYGKLKFLTSSKARALTSNGTLNADGSLFKSFIVRLGKAIKGIS